MLYIGRLTAAEIITLEEMHKHHPSHLSRKRAHSILLSSRGYSVPMICSVYTVCRQTVARWFLNWDSQGLCGLQDSPGRGRPRLLTAAQQAEVVKKVRQSPRSLKTVMADMAQDLGVSISIATLRLICKKARLVWKRVRKSLRSKRDQARFESAAAEIKQLIQQHKNGDIDLCYFDESGFTLEPCVPYAWQLKGETIEVPSSNSKRLNVLGFVNRDCRFDAFVFEGSVTSAVVVACLDWFAEQIEKTTVLIMDNAPTHTSAEFNDNIEAWRKKGLLIYHIPSYSPELNIIEMVWRNIKYAWLPFAAYESFAALKHELSAVLASIGKSHKIAFA